jgi:hypothetical protein
MGITYIPSTGDFAIVDRSADEIFIINSGCVLQDQFDIGTFGIGSNEPYGITYIADRNYFAIADSGKDAAFMFDPAWSGRIVEQFSLSAVLSTSTTGITFVPSSDTFAVVDNSADEAFVVNRQGVLQARFDTSLFATNPQGIAFNTIDETFAIVDANDREVSFLSLPSLVIPVTICACDLNHDGACNILDWPYFIENWGRTDCPMP